MTQATNNNPLIGTPLVATQGMPDETASSAQIALSGDLGLIAIGLVLLGLSGYMFIVKLCKSLASNSHD